MIIELKNLPIDFITGLQDRLKIIIPEKMVIDCNSEYNSTMISIPLGMIIGQYIQQNGSEIEKDNLIKAVYKRKI